MYIMFISYFRNHFIEINPKESIYKQSSLLSVKLLLCFIHNRPYLFAFQFDNTVK